MIYPFLFVIYVVLQPLINNLGEIDPSQAIRPLLVLLLVAILIFFACYWLFKNWHYAGYLVFLVLVFVSLYGHSTRVLQDSFSFDVGEHRLILLVIWSGLFLILGLKKIWSRFGGAGATRALNIFMGILLLIGIISGLPNLPKAFAQPAMRREGQISSTSEINLDCTNSPDIYYIILDGYGRADVLEDLYGVDNSAFLEVLEEKGFYIAKQSHTNYLQSIFSIPSGLSFSYLDSEPENTDAVEYFTNLSANNQIMRTLKQCGYQTIAFETGFYFTDHPQVDLYLSSGSPLNNFENLLLAGSLLDWLPEVIYQKPSAHSYEGHRERVLYAFEQLATIPKLPGPKMVFAHIVSPHPPFVFDAQGNPIEPMHSYSMNDGDDYQGDWDEYKVGYAEQVGFVNRMLEEVLDSILRKSSTSPIIIIQGDHGPGAFHDWDTPEKTCLWERSPILNAYHLPGIDEKKLIPDITPVNSFRIVLNEYFNTDLELLPDKTYFTSHRLKRQIMDVTEQRDSMLNCPQ